MTEILTLEDETQSQEVDENRQGGWILTLTGGAFWPLDPRADEVDIRDIAGALAKQCRFAGHTKFFYSVAQHCVLASYVCEKYPLIALLHDSAEAYCCDIPSPLKRFMPEYKDIELRIEAAIADRFGLPFPFPPEVKEADLVLLATEARDVTRQTRLMWSPARMPAANFVIDSWSWEEAEFNYLRRFEELTK